jgi:hypothetical protein
MCFTVHAFGLTVFRDDAGDLPAVGAVSSGYRLRSKNEGVNIYSAQFIRVTCLNLVNDGGSAQNFAAVHTRTVYDIQYGSPPLRRDLFAGKPVQLGQLRNNAHTSAPATPTAR